MLSPSENLELLMQTIGEELTTLPQEFLTYMNPLADMVELDQAEIQETSVEEIKVAPQGIYLKNFLFPLKPSVHQKAVYSFLSDKSVQEVLKEEQDELFEKIKTKVLKTKHKDLLRLKEAEKRATKREVAQLFMGNPSRFSQPILIYDESEDPKNLVVVEPPDHIWKNLSVEEQADNSRDILLSEKNIAKVNKKVRDHQISANNKIQRILNSTRNKEEVLEVKVDLIRDLSKLLGRHVTIDECLNYTDEERMNEWIRSENILTAENWFRFSNRTDFFYEFVGPMVERAQKPRVSKMKGGLDLYLKGLEELAQKDIVDKEELAENWNHLKGLVAKKSLSNAEEMIYSGKKKSLTTANQEFIERVTQLAYAGVKKTTKNLNQMLWDYRTQLLFEAWEVYSKKDMIKWLKLWQIDFVGNFYEIDPELLNRLKVFFTEEDLREVEAFVKSYIQEVHIPYKEAKRKWGKVPNQFWSEINPDPLQINREINKELNRFSDNFRGNFERELSELYKLEGAFFLTSLGIIDEFMNIHSLDKVKEKYQIVIKPKDASSTFKKKIHYNLITQVNSRINRYNATKGTPVDLLDDFLIDVGADPYTLFDYRGNRRVVPTHEIMTLLETIRSWVPYSFDEIVLLSHSKKVSYDLVSLANSRNSYIQKIPGTQKLVLEISEEESLEGVHTGRVALTVSILLKPHELQKFEEIAELKGIPSEAEFLALTGKRESSLKVRKDLYTQIRFVSEYSKFIENRPTPYVDFFQTLGNK